MSTLVEKIKGFIPNDFFSDAELMRILPNSANSRYGLVKRAIASGDIIHVRRGLYVLSKKHQRAGIDLMELAQVVYAPSYISLESALSYHGWIPEGVRTTTSVSRNRSREFTTPLGVFSYSRMPKYNYIGVERIGRGRSLFLMAEPTKALIDLVFVYKKDWRGRDPLLSSLRIEPENFNLIDKEILSRLKKEKLGRRVNCFIDGLMKDLGK
jgi:predicted transcriptional regulator of viral defense system